MDLESFSKLMELSPFEVKGVLIEQAKTDADRMMLDAGRGNPNWVATEPRHGFWQLGLFATDEAQRFLGHIPVGIGAFPQKDGVEARFEIFVHENRDVPGVQFLHAAVAYVRDHLGINAADFLYEMVCGIIACNYPVPDRMLVVTEKIVEQYLIREMAGGKPVIGNVDIFATEGGTAAMTYIFNSLRLNKLLVPGDKIALARPIFTPYLEIPHLKEYDLDIVFLEADGREGWQVPEAEFDKLLDPEIKAFFLVNPSNPPAVQVGEAGREKLEHIINTKRQDLIVLTDDVYGTFVDDFVSLFAVCPHNTILVYSYSKYFGATGWRIGAIALHEDNVLDRNFHELPESEKEKLDERYSPLTLEPRKIKMIDRMVADSRTVALNHTAGLSTPQQVQMVLFSLFELMDTANSYKDAMKRLVRERHATLYRSVGLQVEPDPDSSDYYTLLSLRPIAEQLYGGDFAGWIHDRIVPGELLLKIAQESGVVLMSGGGFGDVHESARVSLANLNEYQYAAIGTAVRRLLDSYYELFQEEIGKKRKKS
ncbi:MAG: bifunctional aspartate transaminase/aspartate 4-decarboxylase [Alphaproteobacteria bacterium]|nr:bifunctional aspartate transaminase/aspartate 4-decarboxylase [Alphaproteobacteria bacterium]